MSWKKWKLADEDGFVILNNTDVSVVRLAESDKQQLSAMISLKNENIYDVELECEEALFLWLQGVPYIEAKFEECSCKKDIPEEKKDTSSEDSCADCDGYDDRFRNINDILEKLSKCNSRCKSAPKCKSDFDLFTFFKFLDE